MKHFILVLALLFSSLDLRPDVRVGQAPRLADARSGQAPGELDGWKRQAQNVTIVRDDWGIAHVRGKTHSVSLLGYLSAEADVDFPSVDTYSLNS
jgi:acyl-homoserine-lactone acylase